MNKYEHTGKALDEPIAIELIIELFQGKQHIRRKDITDVITEKHIKRGGLPPESSWKITIALDTLKYLRIADNPNRGYWNFLPIDKMMDRFEHFRTIAESTRFRK